MQLLPLCESELPCMPDLADDGPDMLIHPCTKAFMARSVRRVFPLPEQCTNGREQRGDKNEGQCVCVYVRTLWSAEDEQKRLLSELLKAVGKKRRSAKKAVVVCDEECVPMIEQFLHEAPVATIDKAICKHTRSIV